MHVLALGRLNEEDKKRTYNIHTVVSSSHPSPSRGIHFASFPILLFVSCSWRRRRLLESYKKRETHWSGGDCLGARRGGGGEEQPRWCAQTVIRIARMTTSRYFFELSFVRAPKPPSPTVNIPCTAS
ncbi:uncharacterized protein [Triticum aestivum]|uniref:uncharacterized protein n=1 Tax=Triticum aestivum TaxID=4565 RepID=UPI001D014624|nr:uncharacterized protein LOC123172317 [Triticum aestivum]